MGKMKELYLLEQQRQFMSKRKQVTLTMTRPQAEAVLELLVDGVEFAETEDDGTLARKLITVERTLRNALGEQ